MSGRLGSHSRHGSRSVPNAKSNANYSVGSGISPAGVIAGSYAVALEQNSPALAGIIYEFAPDGTRTVFGTTPGQTFGLAFDGAGNLYAADAFDVTIYKFAPDGTRTVSAPMKPDNTQTCHIEIC
jgi:hypothetical protein